MDFFSALKASASGLTAQRLRMNLISGNLANVNTTQTPEGGPYRKKEAIFETGTVSGSFRGMLESEIARNPATVGVAGIVEDQTPPVRKYDPHHPDADELGFVSIPNINIVEEMVNMMSASRSYEANVTAINSTKNMALKALEIGKSS